ncbi:MAG: GldG family protein [Candidatus Gracilibacteria bacterium]|nr:GldG family protein [Candidatus Gracilibacteria bacterium]MDD5179625.1 GldG family protein [Candidatus Gracilibacteria bacterium]
MFSKAGANFLRLSTVFGVLIALIALNVFSAFVSARIDFTEGNIYTLSDSTENIVGSLKDKLVLKVFLSEKLPSQAQQAQQTLKDTLEEYAALSGGKLAVEYVDPASDAAAKSLADSLGIQELSLQVIEKDQQQVLRAYFGLAVLKPKKDAKADASNPLATYDKYESISIAKDLDKLEYNLTAAIKKLSATDVKVVGFLTGHTEHEFAPPEEQNQFAQMMQQQNPRADYPFREKLEKNYQVTSVKIEEAKPEITGINTLVIAGPKEALKDYEVKAIQTFITKGGNAIFLLNQISSELGTQAQVLPVDYSSLLQPWGIGIEPSLVADASNANANFSQGFFSFALPYPLWVKSTDLNRNNSITAQLDSVILPWTSPITITPSADKDLTVETLISSSPHYAILAEKDAPAPVNTEKTTEGNTIAPAKKTPIDLNPQQEFGISDTAKPALPLAVLAQRKGEGKVLIVGNSDFPTKTFGEDSGGQIFLLNAIDSFTLGDDLITIRSKQMSDRPLAAIGEVSKDFIRWGNILLMPVAFIGYGVARKFLRNAKKKALLAGGF